MKFTLPLAAALSVFSISSAAPVPGPGLAALGGLLGPVTNALGGLGNAAGGPQAQAAPVPAPVTESLPPFGSSPSTDMSEPSFEKRATESHVKAVIDAIVKINTDAVAKVLVKLKADVCADLHAKLHLTATGILTTDTDVNVPKVSAKLESETNLAVHTKVDADAKLLVTSRIHAHAESALLKHCPLGDDKCIIELAADIAASIESAVKIDVDHLFTALRANLLTYVRAKVEVVVRDLGLNLFVEQIHVAGFVDATAEINLLLESCYHVIVHALNITIVANVVAVIKALLSV